MADTKEVILKITTNYGEAIDSINRLQDEIAQLKAKQMQLNGALKNAADDFKDGAMSEEEYRKKTHELYQELEATNVQINHLKGQQREYRKEIENDIKAHEENEGSIKQMRLELTKMRKEYESMSKSDRESDAGKAMLEKISDTTEELKGLEQAQGDWRREVGHYQNALENLDPILGKTLQAFKAASGGTMNFNTAIKNAGAAVKTFGKQLLKLAVNPVVAAIVAVVAVVKNLVEQFKKTDEAMTSLQTLFAAFSPILETFRSILMMVVKGLTALINVTTKVVTAVMSLVPGFREASEAAQAWVKQLDDLEEIERQYAVQTAKNNVEIARARNKSVQSDKYSVDERRAALKEAIELEKKNLDMELDVARQKLRLAEQEAARNRDTSDETMNNIAQLEAAYYQAIANSEAGLRRFYSQLSTFNKEAKKEALDMWKTIMGNSALTGAERKAADANWKNYTENLQKKADNFKQIAKGFDVGTAEREQWEANAKQAQKEADEAAVQYTAAHQSMVDNLQSIWKSYRDNETAAQRAYEDAVIDSMDETLEKQLLLIQTESKREIEDLKKKLANSENLSAKARDAINKLIIEKERKLQEQLILTQANYWSEVRQNARDTMTEVMSMTEKLTNADPNRVVGGFIAQLSKDIRSANDEFLEASNKMSAQYQTQYAAMSSVIAKTLEDESKRRETYLMTEGTMIEGWYKNNTTAISENVVTMMKAMLNGTDEFANGATKSLDSFFLAFELMSKRLGMTNDEMIELTDLVKPYLANLQEYYTVLTQMPQKYTAYISNIVYNQVKKDAENIRNAVMESFDFDGLSNEAVDMIKNEIETIDYTLEQTITPWERRIYEGIGFKIEGMFDEFGFKDSDVAKEMSNLEKTLFRSRQTTFKLDWDIETDDPLKKVNFAALGKKYGEEFSNSFSGVLKMLTKSDDVNVQMEWLVKNYESAVQQVEQINKDLMEAYQATGDATFYNARIDESIVLPEMRRIYEMAKTYATDQTDYEYERLVIEGKYVGESNRELKIKNELLSLDNIRLSKEKKNRENQLAYLTGMRGEVAALEKAYNMVNTKNNAEISSLQTQLQILNDEKSTFSDQTSDEIVQKNAQATEEIQHRIDELRAETEKYLRALAATGFLTTDELEAAIGTTTKAIISSNNQIADNTAQQASNVTNMWLTSFNNITGGLSSMGNAFQSLFDTMGEESEYWNSFAKASALFTIGVQMAEGIATAVAKGIEMGWPAAAAMIPIGISTVVSGIAQAKQVLQQYNAPKYADGGLIGGRYAKTRSEGRRDNINIKASKGEYIINAEAVKKYGVEMLDLINYGKKVKIPILPKYNFADGGYVSSEITKSANTQIQLDTMREMMVEAMSEIQPVVSVREITSAQTKVNIAERTAKR